VNLPALANSIHALRASAKWMLLAVAVGVVAGLGSIAFQLIEQTILHFTLQSIAGFTPLEAEGEHRLFTDPGRAFSPWLLLAILTAGGLAAGLLVQKFAPEAEGHGTDAVIEAFHYKRGYMRPIVPLIKLIASSITIGTGGSGGREGPIAQIGAGFGSILGGRLKLSARDRRVLLAAGMGAGIGAIFRAPLAGAIFAAEILYRDADLETDVIMPAAVASIVGYTVFAYWLPPEIRYMPLFGDRLHHQMGSLMELLPMTILALGLVPAAILYIKVFYGTHRWFKKYISRWFGAMLGAFATGACALASYFAWGKDARALAVLGTGYGLLQEALVEPGKIGFGMLLSVALVKMATTSFTISSGGSGGVFGPSMVIGGCTGGAIGLALHALWPELVPDPAIYAILGMAGFFAGAAHAPISTIIMVNELTGDYSLLVPTMWVSTLCFLLCHRWTLYDKQLPSRLDSPAHRGDFLVDVLEGIRVRDVEWRTCDTVYEGMPLREILQRFATSRQHYFPVVDAEGKLVGIFSGDDVRQYVFDDAIWKLAVARDVMTSRVVSVAPEDDMNTALRSFTELNLDELPVLARGEATKLLGMLRRKDVIARYNEAIAQRKAAIDEMS
jgi:CIC family chloride channel protein